MSVAVIDDEARAATDTSDDTEAAVGTASDVVAVLPVAVAAGEIEIMMAIVTRDGNVDICLYQILPSFSEKEVQVSRPKTTDE